MTSVLDWTYEISDPTSSTGVRERVASSEELQRLAEALQLLACQSLVAHYEIAPLSEGRFRLSGGLRAEVAQACVVTLEPVPARIEEQFDVEFWPANQVPGGKQGDLPVLAGPDHEPIEAGRIDVGRIVYEHLSGALDPYPRKEGASLEWQDEKAGAASNPFAILARLKK